VRLFVGISIHAAPGLASAVRDLEGLVPGARLVAPRKRHLTLRFLGEVPDPAPVEAALREGLKDAAPLEGALLGVGGFPDMRRARVAWAGVVAEGLGDVAQKVRTATTELGIPESHPFAAHLTLARLPEPQDLSAWCARHAAQRWGTFAAGSVVLYRSKLGRTDGSSYEELATIPLGRAA
jgi:2'-5' RNA ligase